MATEDKCCTIAPYFNIQQGKIQEFKALCERFVEKTQAEPGCLYFGFSFNGDVAHCRQGFQDADAVLKHVGNVATLLAELLEVADIIRFELHGPEAELAKLRGFGDVNPEYYKLEYGFRR